MNEFLAWWCEKHWLWSTLVTPQVVFAWACWKGLTMCALVAFLIMCADRVRK